MPKLENEQFHSAIVNVFDCEWKCLLWEGESGKWEILLSEFWFTRM